MPAKPAEDRDRPFMPQTARFDSNRNSHNHAEVSGSKEPYFALLRLVPLFEPP